MPTQTTGLDTLLRVLEFAEYQAQLQPMDPKQPALKRLLVGPLDYPDAEGKEDPERFLVADLAWINDLYRHAGRPPDAYTDSLQFFIALPFEVPAAGQAGVCRLIAAYNLLLPLGNYVLDPQGRVALVYRLKTSHDRELAGHVLIETLEQLLFFNRLLARRIEAVAAGKLGVDEARTLTERDLAGLG